MINSTNVCIWRISKNMKDIIPLLNEVHSKQIPGLENLDNPSDEKSYLYKWIPWVSDDFKEATIKIDSQNIQYIEARGYIEKARIPQDMFVNSQTGQSLPKSMIVKSDCSKVIFVEKHQSLYCIVQGPKALEGTIRSKLMQSRSGDKKWGVISFKGMSEFTFVKSFYYWILENKGKNFKEKNLLLQDVRGFKSNTERNAHSYSGTGSNIDEELPLQSLISMDENLASLCIKIIYNNIVYNFNLEHDGRLEIDFNECVEYGVENPSLIPNHELLLTIYFDIIPCLKLEFNKVSAEERVKLESDYRKRTTVQAANTMITKNKMCFEELQEAGLKSS